MDISLTDKGERYPYPTMGRDDELEGERDAFDEGAKAQLKKVAEWLRMGSMDAHTIVFQVSEKEWQALLKEIT